MTKPNFCDIIHIVYRFAASPLPKKFELILIFWEPCVVLPLPDGNVTISCLNHRKRRKISFLCRRGRHGVIRRGRRYNQDEIFREIEFSKRLSA